MDMTADSHIGPIFNIIYIMRNSRPRKGRHWRRWRKHTGTHQVLDQAFDEASSFACLARAGTKAAR